MKQTKKTEQIIRFKDGDKTLVMKKDDDEDEVDIEISRTIDANEPLFTMANVISIVVWVKCADLDKPFG